MSKTTADAASTDFEIQRLKTIRKPLRTNVTKAIKEIERLLTETVINIDDIESQLALLALKEEYLRAVDLKMDAIIDDLDELEKEVTLAQKYQEDITLVRSKAKRVIRKTTSISTSGASTASGGSSTSNSSTQPTKQEPRLPTLEIEKFSGDITKWNSFWSRYEATVGNSTTLTKVEKFHYLSSYLVGEAKGVLSEMDSTEENYDEAVEHLTNRYGRKDIAIHTHMNKLLNLKPVRDSSDLKALRRLYDSCEINIRSLKSLKVDTTANGTFLCPSLLRALPTDIRLSYSKTRDSDDSWDVAELLKFIRKDLEGRETCCLLGAAIEESVHKPPFNREKHKGKNAYSGSEKNEFTSSAAVLTTEVYNKKVFCIFCDDKSHSTFTCVNLSLEEKRKFIQESGRCFNCLREGHEARCCNAKTKSCSKCKGKHNFAVCPRNEANIKKQLDSTEKGKEQISVQSVQVGKTVLLQTAKAVLKSTHGTGNDEEVRCLFDGGSQASFVLEEVSRRLNLPVVGEGLITICNFGNNKPKEMIRRKVKLKLQNVRDTAKTVEIMAIEVPYLCNAVTTVNCDNIQKIMQEKGLPMADQADINTPSSTSISVLIGADFYWEIVTGKIKRFGTSVVALETNVRLGHSRADELSQHRL